MWQETPLTLPLIAASALSILLGIYIWYRYPLPGGKIGSLVIFASTEWMLMYAFELASVDLALKIFWNKLEYIGICSVPTTWFAFAIYYSGREPWLRRRTVGILSIMPIITTLLAFTNEYHGLIWRENILNTQGSFSVLVNVHGLWFWINVAYLYCLILLGASLLVIQIFIHAHALYRRQASMLIAAALTPWIANSLFILAGNPFYPLDPTPISFIIANPIVALSIIYFRLGDIVPMAREVVIESMNDSIIVLDAENRIMDLNPSTNQLMGEAVSKFIGKSIENIWPQWSEQMGPITALERGKEVAFVRGDEQHIYDVNVSTLVDWSGRTISRVVVLRDITERKRAEEKIKASLREKEVLLREIHHRVKNNMQIISSLLRLQSRHMKDGQYSEMLKESQNRIRSMALIHEKLYQSEDLANINLKEYIKTLVHGLFLSYGVNENQVALTIEAEEVSLTVDTAIPCGLIINELVSNSLKHAFPDGKGEICVMLRALNGKIELLVTDNGIGLPEGIDFRTTETLGLRLVTILAEDQLKGDVYLKRDRGTAFHITFGGRNDDENTHSGR